MTDSLSKIVTTFDELLSAVRPSSSRRLKPLRDRLAALQAGAADYAAKNPLGGPAAMFEAIASRLRSGEDHQSVMDDYGIRFVQAGAEQPVGWGVELGGLRYAFKSSREAEEFAYDGGVHGRVYPLCECASPVAQGWQPIETAPKDGTEILVGRAGSRDMEFVRWVEHYEWTDRTSDNFAEPTHWMPLPEPPAKTGEGR